MSDSVLDLTCELIRCRSVTPVDDGCQDLLRARLTALRFAITRLDKQDVTNFYATVGSGSPLFVFAGHTDVVPPGDLADWASPPFEPTLRDGYLFGRGAADMKSSLAAMIVATENFIAKHPQPRGTLAFLITSDEEGAAEYGTRYVVEHLTEIGCIPDLCIVGEPTSSTRLGDTLRNGRRGSLNGTLTIHGVQGHVAYPDLADNPIHRAAPFLAHLTRIEWDTGNDHYPPTSLQISNIAAGTGASNVIPGRLIVDCNFRYSTEQSAAKLQQAIAELLDEHALDATVHWQLAGEPFLTRPGTLTDTVQRAVRQLLATECALSTAGGTSDGRFIAPMGCELVEIGPVNATIHKVDECVSVADLQPLAQIYERVLEELLA
ncbi:MAG: succinyl-diaminopimelate desuccinylase [Gammaproteobacteria bacterium]|nr:succinyl-diaminopimelate desuccinylase [Gammaproteobacteria bacterium]